MKTKLVPATTNNITTAIINFLNSKGHFAFRVNSTGIYDPSTGRWRKSVNRGCADVLACMHATVPMPMKSLGLFYGFEVKNKATKDRISKDQKSFHDKVRKSGGEIIVVKSYQSFLDWYGLSSFTFYPSITERDDYMHC